jgi:hypothetical protein
MHSSFGKELIKCLVMNGVFLADPTHNPKSCVSQALYSELSTILIFMYEIVKRSSAASNRKP